MGLGRRTHDTQPLPKSSAHRETEQAVETSASKCAADGDPGFHPSVSFIVTSYNKQAYLPAVLEMVWAEARSVDGEIILVDDGSTDNSARICEEFARSRQSVVFRKQANMGVYQTLNTAVAMASKEWIRFCDSDDPILPGSTDELVSLAKTNSTPIAFGRSIDYGPKPLTSAEIIDHQHPSGDTGVHRDGAMYLIRRMEFVPSSAIYRRDALNKSFPLPAHLLSCQDLALSLPTVVGTGIAWTGRPTCFHLTGSANQLSAHRVLMWHQITRIVQHLEPILRPHHRRAAIVKAAHRALRYQKIAGGGSASWATRAWLLSLVARAKLGLCSMDAALDAIARLYEREVGPLIKSQRRVY